MVTKVKAKVRTEIERYTYRVTWSDEDGEFVGLCAEFPSLSWLADTQEAALQGIRDVVTDVISDMQSNNESIPEPLSSKNFSGKFTVRIPPATHKYLFLQAKEANVSFNRLISAILAKQ
jgi:predicted HicB family RNase H-like nuclease